MDTYGLNKDNQEIKQESQQEEEKQKLLADEENKSTVTSQDIIENRSSAWYYLKQRSITQNLFLMTVAWIACGFNYYLTGLLVKYFPGDFNMNNFVMFGSDIPGVLFAGWLCQ